MTILAALMLSDMASAGSLATLLNAPVSGAQANGFVRFRAMAYDATHYKNFFTGIIRIQPAANSSVSDAVLRGGEVVLQFARNGQPYAECPMARTHRDDYAKVIEEAEATDSDATTVKKRIVPFAVQINAFSNDGITFEPKDNRGICDTSLTTAGIQVGIPSVAVGDTVTVYLINQNQVQIASGQFQ